MSKNIPTIIVGHYGSGKSEFSANYSLYLSKSGESVTLADMDIVNPYFRIREKREYFEKAGVRVISSNIENDHHNDMPALAGALRTCFEQGEATNVIDVGGDPQGARVLARYSKILVDKTYNMWFVFNANRPNTGNPETAAECMSEIEKSSKLRINGIINATHMLDETSKEDILRGDRLARALSSNTGKKIIFTVCLESLYEELKEVELSGELFPVRMLIRPDWL